jgi:hypothetical protein
MSDQFSAPEKRIIQKQFSFCCREFGIDKKDTSVFLRRERFDHPAKRGVMTKLEHDFIIAVSPDEGIVEFGSVLIHETTHVAQYLRGDMFDDKLTGGTIWKGEYWPRAICNSKFAYSSLPWEIEAHENMEIYTRMSWLCLDEQDREFMMRDAVANIKNKSGDFSVPGVPDWFVKKIVKQYVPEEASGNQS